MTPSYNIPSYTGTLSGGLMAAQYFNPYVLPVVLPVSLCSVPVAMLSDRFANDYFINANENYNGCMFDHSVNHTLRFSPLRLPCEKERQDLESIEKVKSYIKTAHEVANAFVLAALPPSFVVAGNWLGNKGVAGFLKLAETFSNRRS